MGVILEFLSKHDFIKKFGVDLPPALVDCLKDIYDKIIKQTRDLPSLEITAKPSDLDAVLAFKNAYKDLLLTLFKEILQANAEVCVLKDRLSRYEHT